MGQGELDMMSGDHHTEETKKRISEALKGRPGKRPTLETRKKISDSGKGRYATNGGEYCIKELGYFLDYFNSSAKLIIEWDEPHHYDDHGNLNQKDVQRQSEIQDLYSNFEFRRISQWKEPQLSGARGG